MKAFVLAAVVCLTTSLVAGCRSSEGGGDGAAGSGGSSGSGGSGGSGGTGGSSGTTVKQLRMNPPGIGTSVSFSNVVVVGVVTSSRYGDVWVQDQGGGQWSGIHLFCNYGGRNPNCPMSRQQLEAILLPMGAPPGIGKVVSVMGVYQPFTPMAPTGAPTKLEIDRPMITDAGMTMAPVAIDVTSAMVEKSKYDTSTDPYKGVYVRVTPGPLTISNLAPLEAEGPCPIGDAGGMASFGIEVHDGAGNAIEVGLTFHKTMNKCVTGCFSCNAVNQLMTGQMFQSIAGILEPDSNSNSNTKYLNLSPTVDNDWVQ